MKAARPILAVAATVAGLALLSGALEPGGGDGGGGRAPHHHEKAPKASSPGPRLGPAQTQRIRQDPQDRPGSAASRSAQRELREHRALQHVPYRADGVQITLAGARGGAPVLRVTAATRPAAQRGWLRFLRRFHDSGRAYVCRLVARGANG